MNVDSKSTARVELWEVSSLVADNGHGSQLFFFMDPKKQSFGVAAV